MNAPTYIAVENSKDRIKVENLNSQFKEQLDELLSSNKTINEKIKLIEKAFNKLKVKESSLKPYDLYRDGKLIN